MKKGKLAIFCAPSGAGKTTIIKQLLKCGFNLEFSVSATNRKKRDEEVDGIDYYFLSTHEFKKRIENKEFLEWEEVYNNVFYGTLKTEVDRISKKGKNIIFDVDVVGAVNIKKMFPDDSVLVFIMTPSIDELKQRLINRSSDEMESIKKRVDKAQEEIDYYKKNKECFDAYIRNDIIENAIAEAILILNTFLA